MEPPQQQPSAAAGKASTGIPRLSKLPMPRSFKPQGPSAPPPPPPPQQPSALAAAPAKPAIGTPRVAKRASSVNLKTPAKTIPGAPRPLASRSNTLTNAPKAATKPATVASRVKQPIRQPLTSRGRPPPGGEDEETNDQLASLNSFRSASRQGSRSGFRSDSLDEWPLDNSDDAEPPEPTGVPRVKKTSRPSLSDRTIDSLQSVPSTPKDRRRSSFFNPVESPMGFTLRPDSSLSRNGSNGSRPGTSDGTFPRPLSRAVSPGKKAPASAQPASRISRMPSSSSTSASRRSISGSFTSKLQNVKTPSTGRTSSPAKLPAAGRSNGFASKITSGSKTIASSRPAKPRPTLGDAFAPPERQTTDSAPATAAESKRVVSNSSALLRQQIAAAKAAARKEKERAAKHDSPQAAASPADTEPLESDMHADPFNQGPKDDKHILWNRVKIARTDGKLNIAAMGLKEIPEEVLKMYDSAAMTESKVNWAEVVDLTKLIAADNLFEQLDESVFPDVSHEELAADDQSEGNQFGGLEVLDLHGNLLQMLPMGLRRLERLTKLDVAHNKLDNAVFDVVSQMKSLKELRLGHNSLTGNVPTSLCEMPRLEVLDLQANRLLSLPEALRELVSLKVLNVSTNQLTALPMEALQQLPLTELNASGNALIASLFPLGGVNGHSTMQVLNVAKNSLAALSFTEPLHLPQLRSLDVTNNHMTVLPSLAGWTELITLLVGDNKVAEFPPGFTSLQKLRNVNFTSNELRLMDSEIALMPSLESLILASNPLREKKFLTMSAADIKRDLKTRLVVEDPASDLDEPGSPVTVIGDYERPSSSWSLKGNGVLELASKGLSDDIHDVLGSFLDSNEVKRLELQGNKLTYIPPALCMGQDLRVLDLTENTLSADYLSNELHLPSLQELRLSKCRITTWEPLLSQLQAPNLQTLDISLNRLFGALPAMRHTFPTLTTLFVHDNKITSISADALRGLHTVNLTSNDIAQLPAEIGLLWDEGLRSFEVGRNAFRVPNYRLLEKGTQATMRWLMDRMPASEGAFGGDNDELD